MLTGTDHETLLVDATLGRGPSIPGPEAKAQYEAYVKQVKEIKDKGGTVEIPHSN